MAKRAAGRNRKAKGSSPLERPATQEGHFLDRLLQELKLEEWPGMSRLLLGERLMRYYAGVERADDREPIVPWTPRQAFFGDIFADFNEIARARQRIGQAAEFLKRGRSADTISYHVEKYFEEIYVLKNRLISFLRRLQRLLQKRKLKGHALGLKDIEQVVENVFDPVLRLRRAHAHEARFRDQDIERVGSLDLMLRYGRDVPGLFEVLRYHQMRRALTKWRKTTAGNVAAIDTLTGQVLRVVEPIIFDQLAPHP